MRTTNIKFFTADDERVGDTVFMEHDLANREPGFNPSKDVTGVMAYKDEAADELGLLIDLDSLPSRVRRIRIVHG